MFFIVAASSYILGQICPRMKVKWISKLMICKWYYDHKFILHGLKSYYNILFNYCIIDSSYANYLSPI